MADEDRRTPEYVAGQLDVLKDMLRDQNTERQRMHEENTGEIKATREAVTATHALATRTALWIEEKGTPMHDAWMATEKRKEDRRAENRGRLKTWAYIVSAAGTAAGTLGFIGKDAIAAVLEKLARVLH